MKEPPEAEAAKILVVDDRRDDARAIAAILAHPGYEVVLAESGAEALKKVLEHEFAVILMDVVMPVMDGFEVAAIIKGRERSRHVPIIFLTAAGQDVSAIYTAYSVGAVDYLSKPLDAAILRAKVSIFADLFRKDRRIREQSAALLEADRRERELQLAEMRVLSERRYRSLLEMIPASIWTANPEGKVTYCNHRWRETTGLYHDETVAGGWTAAIDGRDGERGGKEWEAALRSGQGYMTELRLRTATGGARWHLGQMMPERDPDGALRGWVAVFADCEDLKGAVEARDLFLSIASHELRTPLTTLMLQLESIQRGIGPLGAEERVTRKVDGAIRQIQRLDRLVGDLLDVSRICTGRLELERDEVDITELVKSCVERFADQAQKMGTQIEFEAAGSVRGRWDSQRVEQVITNLLSNAIKYGGGKPVSVEVAQKEGQATIRVRDQGIGIEPAHQARIFGRFERAVSSRNYGGLGIGLFITKQIVEAHGGAIEVSSQVGAGSTFSVTLPSTADDQRPPGPHPPEFRAA